LLIAAVARGGASAAAGDADADAAIATRDGAKQVDGCQGGTQKECLTKAIQLESTDPPRAGQILATLCEAGDLDGCSEASTVFDLPNTRDGQKSAAYGKRACEAGRGHNCFQTGLLFWQGRRDVARNYATAVHLYTIGCDHNDEDACAELSVAYRKGLGVKRDRARANAIWKKAEALGYRGE